MQDEWAAELDDLERDEGEAAPGVAKGSAHGNEKAAVAGTPALPAAPPGVGQVIAPPVRIRKSFPLEAIGVVYAPATVVSVRVALPTGTTSPPPPDSASPTTTPASRQHLVVLHALYRVPEAVVPHLPAAAQGALKAIQRHVDRLCPPYGLRATLTQFVNGMANAPTVGDTPAHTTGGHFERADALGHHLSLCDVQADLLRRCLLELYEQHGDEAAFGPAIGFELNHALVLWVTCRRRLMARRQMALFRESRDFLSAMQTPMGGVVLRPAGSPAGSPTLSGSSAGGPSPRHSLAMSNEAVHASSVIGRYGGISGAVAFIHRNLPLPDGTREARAAMLVVMGPLVLAAEEALGTSASVTPAAAAAARRKSRHEMLPSSDNWEKVRALAAALLVALDIFRYEFDVIDESVLTIDAIEAATSVCVAWLAKHRQEHI